MKTIFFYGLFMDRALLAEKGLHPTVLGRAEIDGFRIQVGARATLVPADGRRACGVVMRIAPEEIRALYSDPGVRDYEPVAVRVRFLATGETVVADCYILPPRTGRAGTNPAYATALAQLVQSLGFDSSYVDEIAAFSVDPGRRP